jgi:multidrug efflux pump subunit AcrA (membrane-fusion protein)
LVRADLPGRHLIGAVPAKALLDVDGVEVPGRILGVLGQFTELQSAGLLIEVRNPPAGLASGARIPVSLYGAQIRGMQVPRDAVLYDENGAYVYKQVAAKNPKEKTRYVPVKVTLLVPYGDGWLVKGVDDDDDIVVSGAGVLWSLEGMGAHPVDDDEDED